MLTDEVREALQAARDLIADPEHWTQGTLARDERGWTASTDSPKAVMFCARGAIYRVSPGLSVIVACDVALKPAIEGVGYERLTALNDSTDHATVLAMFDKTLADETIA